MVYNTRWDGRYDSRQGQPWADRGRFMWKPTRTTHSPRLPVPVTGWGATLEASLSQAGEQGPITYGRPLTGSIESSGGVGEMTLSRLLRGAVLPFGLSARAISRLATGGLALVGTLASTMFTFSASTTLTAGPGADSVPDEYELGSLVVTRVKFEVATEARNPSEVLLTVRKPNGAVLELTEPDIVNLDTGLYECEVNVDVPGRWRLRWEGTNPAQGVVEAWFDVRRSRVS